jgi:hypothetical protein
MNVRYWLVCLTTFIIHKKKNASRVDICTYIKYAGSAMEIKRKKVRLNLRVPDDQFKRLKQASKVSKLSASEIVRRGMDVQIDNILKAS